MAIDDFKGGRASNLKRWKRNRDHCGGVDSVKNAGISYLPKSKHMTPQDYESHKLLTEYKPAAARTLASHVGLVFRKAPTLTAPDSITQLTTAVEATGESLEATAKWALREFSITNDGGLLIDHPAVPEGLSLAQALALDLRPFLARYSAESIKAIEYSVVGGRKRLTRVVLMDDDETARELALVAGQYTITIWNKLKASWQAGEPFTPLANGQPITSIPFVHLGDGERTAPFDDIVNTNLTHYAVAGELAVALKHCARPQRTIAGLDEDVELDYSPGITWRFTDKDTKLSWNEFTGAGIGAIERQLDRLVKSMAEQGLRLLISEQAPAESTEATQRREASENSILASNARHVSGKLTDALKFMGQWLGNNEAISYALNTDFVPATIDPQVLQQMVLLNQAGKLSDRQLFINMRKGEIISEDVDYEQHQAELETQPIDQPLG